jgi:hypothetical protein
MKRLVVRDVTSSAQSKGYRRHLADPFALLSLAYRCLLGCCHSRNPLGSAPPPSKEGAVLQNPKTAPDAMCISGR